MIDRCLGPIGTHVGSRVSKERASEVSCAEWFSAANVYHIWSQRNSRINGEVKTVEIKVKRVGKDVKFRMMFKGNHSEKSHLL